MPRSMRAFARDGPLPDSSLRLLVAALATGLLLPAAAPAQAQVGLGAERYEVTITPPKRPGTEAPVDAESGVAPEAAPAGEAAAPADADAAPASAPASAAGSATTAAPVGTPAAVGASPASAASVKTEPAATRAGSNLPLKTLQVGAFRQKDSATDLRAALASGFQEVAIVEVQSGGEPLYRVIVGRQPHGPALDDLKRRLAAAGHPAFEVPAPPASGSR